MYNANRIKTNKTKQKPLNIRWQALFSEVSNIISVTIIATVGVGQVTEDLPLHWP